VTTGLTGQTYKVAIWATGGVGRFAIRTIVDRPNLELVGAWVHSAQKDGEDVGTLAGIAPIGVRATRNESEVLDGGADCVVYAAPAGGFGPSRRWTTCAASWPPARTSSPRRFPGWCMSARYPVEFDMRELFGFGQPLDYQGGLKSPGVLTWGWGAAVTMVADALGVQLDEIREECEFLPTPRRLETACGVIGAGTVGATYGRCIGVVDGADVITIEHVDRMADDLAPDWPKSRTGNVDGTWRVIIEGEPSFDAEFEVGFRTDENSSDQGLLATGMRAVNAIPWVCASEPGIVDELHLPLTSPLGALHPRRDGVPAF
jgi:hypothetical protein